MKQIETRRLDFACVRIDLESGPSPPCVLFAHESPKMLSVFAVNPGKKHLPREGAPTFVQDGFEEQGTQHQEACIQLLRFCL